MKYDSVTLSENIFSLNKRWWTEWTQQETRHLNQQRLNHIKSFFVPSASSSSPAVKPHTQHHSWFIVITQTQSRTWSRRSHQVTSGWTDDSTLCGKNVARAVCVVQIFQQWFTWPGGSWWEINKYDDFHFAPKLWLLVWICRIFLATWNQQWSSSWDNISVRMKKPSLHLSRTSSSRTVNQQERRRAGFTAEGETRSCSLSFHNKSTLQWSVLRFLWFYLSLSASISSTGGVSIAVAQLHRQHRASYCESADRCRVKPRLH